MTDAGRTGETRCFSSDCKHFLQEMEAWMFGSGNAAVAAHPVWFRIAVHILMVRRGSALRCGCVRTVSLHLSLLVSL